MLTLKIQGQGKFKVADLVEASRRYQIVRDESGLGGSKFRDGIVFDGVNPVARISYNGRVWPNQPWTPELQVIMEATKIDYVPCRSIAALVGSA